MFQTNKVIFFHFFNIWKMDRCDDRLSFLDRRWDGVIDDAFFPRKWEEEEEKEGGKGAPSMQSSRGYSIRRRKKKLFSLPKWGEKDESVVS